MSHMDLFHVGLFHAGVFHAGLFHVGLFQVDMFHVGLCRVGLFHVCLFRAGMLQILFWGSYYNMLFIASKLSLHYKKLTYFGAYVLKCETFPSTICGPTSRKGVTLYGSGFGGMISLLMACR